MDSATRWVPWYGATIKRVQPAKAQRRKPLNADPSDTRFRIKLERARDCWGKPHTTACDVANPK